MKTNCKGKNACLQDYQIQTITSKAGNWVKVDCTKKLGTTFHSTPTKFNLSISNGTVYGHFNLDQTDSQKSISITAHKTFIF